MNIHLYDVVPEPLKDRSHSGQIWAGKAGFEKGKHYLIRAESGRGKSTLLNIIYGIRKDFTGRVKIGEYEIRNISANSWSHFRSEKFAYLFQDLRLFPAFTAIENIRLKAGNVLSDDEIHYFATKLEIADQLKKTCSKLSFGQQQRVAILRAISQHFEWIFLDEPFSHLDQRNAGIALECVLERARMQEAGIIATSLGNDIDYPQFNIMEL